MRTAVITLCGGRLPHLRNQLRGIAAGSRRPDTHIVVALGDPALAAAVTADRTRVVEFDCAAPLPLAAARNLGARAALAEGAEVLIFLDVDCVPGPTLLARYHDLAATGEPALWCGPVTYLPPPPPAGYDLTRLGDRRAPHPARPDPGVDGVVRDGDHDLFWSLSFALTAETWRTLGGFHPGYRGYGGEDTDFGAKAAAAGIPLHWAGGADAYHQYHPVSDPPVEHRTDILANAAVFHRRWGRWPMTGWLRAFADAGLADYDPARDLWTLRSRRSVPSASATGGPPPGIPAAPGSRYTP
ncbi:glycosyltransferase family 2 protein [Nocardia sp. NPDC057353]|uniref:glycosyltransferase family 2 protein n=1 Tax=Nocardia sp. NPDC057353 TaxID=3346104 RepID=UPI00363A35E5